jgi:hypothetical protein
MNGRVTRAPIGGNRPHRRGVAAARRELAVLGAGENDHFLPDLASAVDQAVAGAESAKRHGAASS